MDQYDNNHTIQLYSYENDMVIASMRLAKGLV